MKQDGDNTIPQLETLVNIHEVCLNILKYSSLSETAKTELYTTMIELENQFPETLR